MLFLMGVCAPVWSQEVGQGAPQGVGLQFQQAFNRNGFNTLVSKATSNVRAFGGTGFIQEFSGVQNTEARFALIKGNSDLSIPDDAAFTVFQMYPAMFNYYSSIGVATAGFPTMDTSSCTLTGTSQFCGYQVFDKDHALFVFTTGSLSAATSVASYTVSGLMFTRWQAAGGLGGVGVPSSAPQDITSTTGIAVTVQQFTSGALYSITSGALGGRVFPVKGKVYTLYASLGLHNGALGIPLTEELVSGGKIRQNFEGGQIEYSATTDPVVRPAVGGVSLSIATTDVTRMNLGETLTLRANVLATTGQTLTDREVSWTTSNSRVVSVQPNGATAVLRAAGGGTAIITAVSEGKASGRLTIFVAAPCCQIGEGAPTAAIQQAFQDTVTRFRISVKLPAANPVQRVGLGYVQELVSSEGSQRYLLCRADRSPGVFLVTGALLEAYFTAGGPAGRLGYPTADASGGGRQNFENGLLAGNPVYAVSGAIATRWQALGFEAGVLGPPAGLPVTSLSFAGTRGTMQPFANGALVEVEAPSGPRVTFVVAGLVLARYLALGGIGGTLGVPLNDEHTSGGEMRQDFEGGALLYAPGETEARLEERERTPKITVTPSKVTAGGRVRVAVGGFRPGAGIRVSFSGEGAGAPFAVQSRNGSYTWEQPVAASAQTGIITIRAQEADTDSSAAASLTVTSLAEAGARLVKLRGDTQSGQPGGRLLSPLAVSLVDEAGSPLIGIAVQFAASPGAQVVSASAVTNEKGEAEAIVRLHASDGIALFTAEAAGKVVTFSARAAGTTLPNFPGQTQAGSFNLGLSSVPVSQKGALLAAVSSILRYHQNRSELPSSLGFAEPAVLNDFLKNNCPFDVAGGRICDGFLTPSGPAEPVLNLFRLREFVGGLLDVQYVAGGDAGIRDALAAGRPVLLALRLTSGESVLGSHFVVATGVSADGGLVIHDPSPVLNRKRLDDYFTGLRLGGQEVKAEIMDAILLLAQSPSPTGFLVSATQARIGVRSRLGECGKALEWPNAAVAASGSITAGQGTTRMYYCEGRQPAHVVQLDGAGASVTDLGSPGRVNTVAAGGEYLVTRPSAQWQVDPLQISLSANEVVNAATLTRELAPGSLAAVFGSGLARQAGGTRVEVSGVEARVASASEFRLNVEIPVGLAAGEHQLTVVSPYGTAQIPLTLRAVAPFIFINDTATTASVVNPDGRFNSAAAPVARGQTLSVYATGLGAVIAAGDQMVVERPVVAVIQGVEVPVSFAGLAPELPGVYVVNVSLPTELAPGLGLPLLLRVDGAESNAVEVSIR
ncbi:MAG: papain-like cysteine protease family protein [Bryobacteraceae bacterium]|nr:papain-like cysteine protease family protein [Bryobacteraceae bacterium]